MIPKLDWKVIVNAAVQVWLFSHPQNMYTFILLLILIQIGHGKDLPMDLIENYEDNEDFLKKVHHVLMEVS